MAVVGIDIGGTKCTVALADAQGEPVQTRRFPTAGPWETLERVGACVEALGVGEAPVFGIACGGPLDAAGGVVLSPPNLPGWDRVPVVRLMEERFGGRAFVMNDANAGVLAEWQAGAGRGRRHVVFLTLGTGFGAGVICDGRLLEGASGQAGEIGHVRVTDDGPVGYGKRGSAEGWCSGGGIGRRVADLMATGRLPRDWPYRNAKALAEAARAGETEAKAIFAETGRRLGQCVAMLVDVLNPEVIVLGSLFLRAADLIEGPMREVLAKEALPASLAACTIVPAGLGERLPEYQAVAVAHYRLGLLAGE